MVTVIGPTPRHRGDVGRFLGDAIEVDVAHETARLGSLVDAHIDHDGAGLHHLRGIRLGWPAATTRISAES